MNKIRRTVKTRLQVRIFKSIIFTKNNFNLLEFSDYLKKDNESMNSPYNILFFHLYFSFPHFNISFFDSEKNRLWYLVKDISLNNNGYIENETPNNVKQQMKLTIEVHLTANPKPT